ATSTAAQDDIIEKFCTSEGIHCFRGNEDDVLDRFYRAAELFSADPIIRITADCPCVDPAIIDSVIQRFDAGIYDHVAVACGASAAFLNSGRYPDGIGGECLAFSSLKRAWAESSAQQHREH